MTEYYHIFPFEKIDKGTRLIIYGAGEVGQWYLAQLRKTGYAEIVAVADRDWDKYPSLGVPMISPQQIRALDFDFVLVSIESRDIAVKVSRMLVNEYGILAEKIILGSDSLDEIPFFVKPGMKSLPPPVWASGDLPVAVCLSGGLGDCIIYKRKLEEILKWDERIVLDCFVKESMLPAMHSFFDGECEGRIHAIISGERAQYLMQREYYVIALELGLDVQDVFVNEAWQGADALLAQGMQLREQSQIYGNLKPSQYVLHYARCAKDGLNCYQSYNRYDGFDVQDWHTHIPLCPDFREQYKALELSDIYITLNYGFDMREDMRNCKAWPLEYFAEFLRLFRLRYPGIQTVQVSAADMPRIEGCDHAFIGESLELVKYILQGSFFHLDIEGGLVHLASQLGTMCVVLFGPTPLEYYGYRDNLNLQAGVCQNCCWYTEKFWRCYRGMMEPECMFGLKPEHVLGEIEKMLKVRRG